jgi:asparagine synthase (glutamine-hydrolysing)
VLRFDLDACRDGFDALAAGAEYPFADPAGVPTLLAFRHARTLGTVALDGTGADTLLGIMPARHQRIAVGWSARLPHPLRRRLAALMAPVPGLRDYRPLLEFGDPEEVLTRWQGFTRREIEALCGAPVPLAESRFYRIFRRYPRHAHFERYSALMGNLPDDRIHVAAAMTGLRVRFPFFAPEVEALVRGLDRDLRWRPDEPKRVLKAALAGRVPRALWDVPKHGFDFPFADLLAHRDLELVRTWLTPSRLDADGLPSPAAVQALAEGFIAGDRRQAFRVWALVVLSAWLGTHDL